VFTKNTAFNKNFGTTAGTVAQGNDSRIINGQTAFGWGNHSDQNYFKSTFLRAFVVGAEGYDANEANLTGGFVGSYYSSNWLTNRAFDGYGGLITWKGTSSVGLKLQMQYDAGHLNPSGGRLAFRTSYNSSGEIFTNWKEIWHTGNLTSLSQLTDNIGVATHIANTSNPHSVTKAQVGLGNVDNTADSAKNVLSASKLQTARTIAGVSFDGTANIAIPFANLSSKPTTLGGYGITDAVTLNTPQEITGAKTFTAGMLATTITSNYWHLNDNATNPFLRLTRAGQNWYVQAVSSGVALGSTLSNSILITSVGDVGIGTTSPSEKLHVVGNILATGTTTTTKVIFNAAGWSMEQVGSELQMKYNNVLKMRFTSTGSIIATEEITAFA
jgi:hypothetical protein